MMMTVDLDMLVKHFYNYREDNLECLEYCEQANLDNEEFLPTWVLLILSA